MILEREQINRYMRHIIMPEISGAGQKKLLDSSILVCCDNLSNSALLLYYLTAMGIGKIQCYAGDTSGNEPLLQNLQELNPYIEIVITDDLCRQQTAHDSDYSAVIVSAEKAEISVDFNSLPNIPIMLTAANRDCGLLQTFGKGKNPSLAYDVLNSFYLNNNDYISSSLFNKACISFLGTLAAVEAVKVLLDIGCACENALQFDLAGLDFKYDGKIENPLKYDFDQEQISMQLSKAKALIIGSGGLGSPAAYMLASMGIGRLGLVDYDTVEISNLNRQILHSTDKIGMTKVKSAEEFLKRLNPEIELCTYEQKFSAENAEELIKDYDIIIDGLDNLPTRYLLNDVCYFLKKPLIEAGVLRFYGLAAAIQPDLGPCYRCMFHESTDNNNIPSCAETGVLGAVPGVMGIIQAVEVLKYLTGIGTPLVNKLLMFDALNLDITVLDIYKNPSCPLCGNNPTIDSLKDYKFVCNSKL